MQNILEAASATTGLTWAGGIIATTCCFRFLMLPLIVGNLRNSAKLNNAKPEIDLHTARMKQCNVSYTYLLLLLLFAPSLTALVDSRGLETERVASVALSHLLILQCLLCRGTCCCSRLNRSEETQLELKRQRISFRVYSNVLMRTH